MMSLLFSDVISVTVDLDTHPPNPISLHSHFIEFWNVFWRLGQLYTQQKLLCRHPQTCQISLLQRSVIQPLAHPQMLSFLSFLSFPTCESVSGNLVSRINCSIQIFGVCVLCKNVKLRFTTVSHGLNMVYRR